MKTSIKAGLAGATLSMLMFGNALADEMTGMEATQAGTTAAEAVQATADAGAAAADQAAGAPPAGMPMMGRGGMPMMRGNMPGMGRGGMPMRWGGMPRMGQGMPMAAGGQNSGDAEKAAGDQPQGMPRGMMMGRGMPMRGQRMGMMNPQMMGGMMQMKQQHMQRMEQHLANIESLLRELVEQGKK